jgi:FkbH-like protein
MQLKEKEASSQLSAIAIAIAATFTAEPVGESLAFWMQELDIPSKIDFAPYNQVFQQLLAPDSLLAQNNNGINVILVRIEDWEQQEERAHTGVALQPATQQHIERNVADLVRILKSVGEHSATPQLLCLCPASPAAVADSSRQTFFQQMENVIASELDSVRNLFTVTSQEFASLYPVTNYYDAHTDELGHIPYTPAFFAALGSTIARKIARLSRAPYKVILLDCDQTLWKGVCGEDGAMGIEIDTPRKVLQEFMVVQQQAGTIIGLCSKNIEADVFEVFDRRPEMPLKREHIVSWRINWQPKSENIKSLAQELNLGLDSFIFIDDNPVECAEVQANCPEVLTLLLPSEVEEIPRFLNHIWAFDQLKVTEEDKKRTALYKQNAERERFRSSALTLDNFLEGLGLEIDISEMAAHHLPRVAQLTQRTNQFNFTTIRRSESEIQQLCESGQLEGFVVEVRDRFGDYGLVGAMLFGSNLEAINVDTFLLSCRALGRGVEHRMLAKLGKIAEDRGLSRVDIGYIPTKKNQPAFNFIESISSVKEAVGDVVRYQVPVEVAAAVSYQPSAASDVAENPATKNETSLQNASVRLPEKAGNSSSAFHRTLIRIASELYNAEQILQVIESQKLRSRPAVESSYIAPRTPVEEVLEGIWARVLGVDKVGVEDNFFELGGHSLLLTQLISRIRDNFQIELSMQRFFEAPTVSGLALLLDKNQEGPMNAEAIAELLKMVNRLSEAEAKAMLEAKMGTSIVDSSLSLSTEDSELNNQDLSVYTQPYRIGDIEQVAIRAGQALVYSRNSRRSLLLNTDVVRMLCECRQFKTLEEHAQNICQDVGANLEAIKHQLAAFVEAGFLISQQQLLEKIEPGQQIPVKSVEELSTHYPIQNDSLRSHSFTPVKTHTNGKESAHKNATNSTVASVGMVTCNRIEGAKRALASYIENSQQHGRTNNFVLMDDSASSQTRDGYRQMLHSLKTQYGAEIFYAGLEEKQRFAQSLIQKGGLPQDIVNFALFDVEKSGASPGANRNALTLHTAGDIIFSADDDTVCKLVPSPELQEGLTLTAGTDPSDYWVFDDRETALKSVKFADKDLLALHEQLLGKNVGAILEAAGNTDTVNINPIDNQFMRRLEVGVGKVLVTFNGLVGDCGWGAPFGYWAAPLGYLLLAGKSHERLVQSESGYRNALTSRDILRVTNRLGISDDSFGMTTFVGLDNRGVLPPFLPVRRGQDLIFSNTVWKCFKDSFFGHLPWALLHEPVEQRKFWSGEIFRTASGFDTAKLIVECIKSCEFGPAAADEKERLRSLGKHLIELGSMPLAGFEEFLRLQVWRTSSSFISLAEEHLRMSGESPVYWANDVKKYTDLLCQSLTRDDYFIPLDLVQGRNLDEARQLAQRLVLKFGQLLYWWPEMIEVTKELRHQGERLGRLI